MNAHAFDPRPVAQRFWERAGVVEPFPRRLTPTIAAVLPIAVILLPKLTITAMSQWLARRGVGRVESLPDRSLCGCLIALRGHAFMFVDGSLDDDEQRLTIAHEAAHFIHHYDEPRTTALDLLGSSIAPVLDGDRPATSAERLRGVLRAVPIGVYEHMLDRIGGSADTATSRAEVEADLIAFELLAPCSIVRRATNAGIACSTALREHFGLPPWAATRWGAWIDSRRGDDRLISRLQAARRRIDR